MPSNEKWLFFFVFSIYQNLKMHGLKSNLIYSPSMYKKEITQAGYQAKKHPAQPVWSPILLRGKYLYG
jgi:hypothetical protein